MCKLERQDGKVIWFDDKKGYGFLSWKIGNIKQKDIFVHFSDIQDERFKSLKKDERVQFNLGNNYNNQPKATNVIKTTLDTN